MNGFIADVAEQRLWDVSLSVALLLTIAFVLVRLVWQPAKRLCIIQWSLVGGLLLAVGFLAPWSRFSLGVFQTAVEPAPGTIAAPSPQKMFAKAERTALVPERRPIPPSRRLPSRVAEESATTKTLPPVVDAPVQDPQVAASPPPHRISWCGWILRAYLACAIGVAGWLILGQCSVYWLVRRSTLPAEDLLHAWQELQAAMQRGVNASSRTNMRLFVSDALSHPIAAGVFRPTVLLPRWLVQSHTPEQLRPILAHEIAHLVRRDAVLRWLAAMFQILFFYQPLFWWLRREMRLCQEYLADACAADLASSPADYAEQLITLLKSVPAPSRRPLPAIGIIEGKSELYRRIQMLVAMPRPFEFQLSKRWNLLTAFALLIFAPALGLVTLQAADPMPQSDSPISKVAQDQSPPSREAEKPAPVKKSEDREYLFDIVDTKGEPVAGAKVQLYSLMFDNGSSGGIDEKWIPPVLTDSKGIAHVRLPLGKGSPIDRTLREFIEEGFHGMGLRIEHPDHPTLSDYFPTNAVDPIVLQDSTTIEIRAHRADDKSPLQRLYPSISGPFADWSETEGLLTIRRVDLKSKNGSHGLRVVHVPETGPAWFSEVIELRQLTGNPIVIDAALKPGVRFEGRLSDVVPRPVKDGYAVAVIVSGANSRSGWYWQAATQISPDGTFVIESLPADENLQVIAVCDGWVSENPSTKLLNEYEERYGYKNLLSFDPQTTDRVYPQLYRLGLPANEATIAMHPMGSCEVTVQDESGKPIPGAMVHFSPNRSAYHSGSFSLGPGSDSLTRIKEVLETGQHATRKSPANKWEYWATADDRGIAVVRNLPAGKVGVNQTDLTTFSVGHEGYLAIPNYPGVERNAFYTPLVAKLVPGETAKVTVRMQKNAPQVGLPDVAEDELAGRVVDDEGNPLADVQVLVWEQDEDKIRTDADGEFRYKIETTHGDEKHLLVRFKKPGYAPYLVVDWRLGSKGKVVVMENKTYFEGIVLRPDGKPAADVLIRANQGPKEENPACVIMEVWTETRTDAAGKYKLLLQPDSYAIDLRAPGVGTARVPKAGEEGDDLASDSDLLPQPPRPKIRIGTREARRLDIQLEPGVEFRAKIVDMATGKPVPNVRLFHWQHPGIEGRSDGAGLVTIPTMPEGEFTFMIDAPDRYIQGWSDEIPQRWKELIAESRREGSNALRFSLDEGAPFDLTLGMPQVTISLEPGVTISGRVFDPDGKPVAGATVAPARSGKGWSYTGDTSFSVATKEDGTFQVVLPPTDGQKYNLIAHDGKYREWRNWANGVGAVLQTEAGQTFENVELRLTRPGIVRGRTVDGRGRPVAGVYVQTRAEDLLEHNYYNPATRSDQDGNFELPFVRPGKHLVQGWMTGREEEMEETFPVVEVRPGETTLIGDIFIPEQFHD